jgi:hypothetical protein
VFSVANSIALLCVSLWKIPCNVLCFFEAASSLMFVFFFWQMTVKCFVFPCGENQVNVRVSLVNKS